MKTSAFGVAVLLGCFVGCSNPNVYRVELTPDGDEVRRTLSVEYQTGRSGSSAASPSNDEADRIAKCYDEASVIDEEGRVVFSGRFRGEMPNDVGGSGSYTHFTSSLGTASIYSERFRGEDDLVGALLKRQAAIDELVDLLTAWVDYEIDDPTAAERIRRFLDDEVRRDLKNLCLHLWSAIKDVDEASSKTPFFRMAQYLAERDYFSVSEIPKYLRRANDNDWQSMADRVRSIVIRKIESADHQPAPNGLSALNDFARVQKSMREFLRTTENYKRLVSKWKREGQSITSDSPDPMQVFGDLAIAAALPNFGSLRDRIEVQLRTDVVPLETNGEWDAASKTVGWSEEIDRVTVPAFAYAAWSVPEIQFQTEHFGRVFLQGEELLKYVTWYRGLNDDEAGQWDAMLRNIDSHSDAISKLRAFKFDNDSELAESIANTMIVELRKPISTDEAPKG